MQVGPQVEEVAAVEIAVAHVEGYSQDDDRYRHAWPAAAQTERVYEGPVDIVDAPHEQEHDGHGIAALVPDGVEHHKGDEGRRLHEDPPQAWIHPRAPAPPSEPAVGRGHEEEGDKGDHRQGYPPYDQPVIESALIHGGTYIICGAAARGARARRRRPSGACVDGRWPRPPLCAPRPPRVPWPGASDREHHRPDLRRGFGRVSVRPGHQSQHGADHRHLHVRGRAGTCLPLDDEQRDRHLRGGQTMGVLPDNHGGDPGGGVAAFRRVAAEALRALPAHRVHKLHQHPFAHHLPGVRLRGSGPGDPHVHPPGTHPELAGGVRGLRGEGHEAGPAGDASHPAHLRRHSRTGPEPS